MKNMIFKSLLLVFLFAGISFGQDYFKEAQNAMKKNNVAAAFNLAKDAFSKDSINTSWKILLLIKEKKSDVELFDLLAQVWEKMKVTSNAISNYEEAEKLDPRNIKRKYILADMYYKENQIKESANKYLEIIKLDSTSKEAYLKIGNIFYLAKKDFAADAGVYLEKALKYYNDLDLYHKCVKAYAYSNNVAKAYEISAKGLELYPKDLELRKAAWVNAIPIKKYEEALKNVVLIPDSLLSSNEAKTAGDIAAVLKNQELNTKYYKLAGEKDPNNKDLFVNLGDRAYNDKEYDKAIEYYNKKLSIDPKHEHSLQFKAYAYNQKADYNGARQAFLDWLAVSDTSVDAHWFLAECYDRGKVDSLSRKIEVYNKILRMIDGKEKQYKNYASAINYFFGMRNYDAKNWSNAIPYFKKVMQYRGEELDFLILVAACYENLKDYDNAVAYLQKAKRISPNNELVKKGLRRLSAD